MKKITIWTDGSCLGNPGPCGYAAILLHEQKTLRLSGRFAHGTNNAAELAALTVALRAITKPCEAEIVSDSAYLINNMRYLPSWEAASWRKSDGKPVANAAIWAEISRLLREKRIVLSFRKVAGHAGVDLNEACDAEARRQASLAKAEATR